MFRPLDDIRKDFLLKWELFFTGARSRCCQDKGLNHIMDFCLKSGCRADNELVNNEHNHNEEIKETTDSKLLSMALLPEGTSTCQWRHSARFLS
jgi:hypothetical protein